MGCAWFTRRAFGDGINEGPRDRNEPRGGFEWFLSNACVTDACTHATCAS